MNSPLLKVDDYCRNVLNDKIPVSAYVKRCVEKFVNLPDKYYFDTKEAEFAIRFIECLKHSKGVWAKTNLELQPWQAFIVANLFGVKEKSTNYRRYKTAFVSVARKNGKSTLAAAIGLKLFAADNEYGAEVYTAATKRAQARIVHEEATKMVKTCSLKNYVKILRDNLLIEKTFSKYEPLGADVDGLDGLNVHGAIIDELHAHRNRKLWDVLDSATGARVNPLILCITTAGDVSDCIYSEIKSYAIKCLMEDFEDSWFSFICTLDNPDEELHEPDTWIKSNPNLGVSITHKYLHSQYKKGLQTPAGLINFKRRHLNIDTSNFDTWDGAESWPDDENWYENESVVDVLKKYSGKSCYVGADLSSVVDVTALSFVFQEENKFHVIPICWVPRKTAILDEEAYEIPYYDMARKRLLFVSEGSCISYEEVKDFLVYVRDSLNIKIEEIAVDPHNARYLLEQLDKLHFNVFEHKQTFVALNDPIKTFHRAILSKEIKHGNHPFLDFCVRNARIITDTTGNVKFEKSNRGSKVDVLVATAMALYRAKTGKKSSGIYNRRGVVFI